MLSLSSGYRHIDLPTYISIKYKCHNVNVIKKKKKTDKKASIIMALYPAMKSLKFKNG